MQNFFPMDVNGSYYAIEAARMQLSPMRLGLSTSLDWLASQYNPFRDTDIGRAVHASYEILERITRKYKKPIFGITKSTVNGKEERVTQRTVLSKAFCELLHFKKPDLKVVLPKLLIVAPMAGHHATLLRGTVEGLLPYADVYITDWIDASRVPLSMGSFDMDDFIEYVIEFIRTLGPDLHVMAVCQPTVPVLAAISIMSQAGDPQIPKSMTLMGGPVDARKNPTKVNCFATARSIDWFKHTVIMPVPPNYPGYMRQVYPGFLQLAGFMSLNIARHIDSHLDMFKNLFLEEDEKAEADKKFYDEYLSVMDLPAEFYIQTIKQVFQDFDLAKGKLISRGRKVDTRSITKCALLGIEGERDDIAAVGQTKAALDLCDNIPNDKKHYHMQHGVGHYGVFSGSKFKKHIVPVITDFINRV